eukprot:gene3624-3887_t
MTTLQAWHPHEAFRTGTEGSLELADWLIYENGQCSPGYSPCLLRSSGEVDVQGIYGVLVAYAVLFVAVVWATVALVLLDPLKGDASLKAGWLQKLKSGTARNSGADELHLTDVVKAFTMYAQYFAGIIVKLPLTWPAQVGQVVQKISNFWSAAMGSAASLDCAVPNNYIKDLPGVKALITLLQPLAVFLLASLHVSVRWPVTLLVTVFFFYPSIARVAVTMFTCIETVILVCVSVCGMVLHEYYQTLILAVVFGTYLILIAWLQPFKALYAQWLQSLTYAGLMTSCFLILGFIPPEYLDDRQHDFFK